MTNKFRTALAAIFLIVAALGTWQVFGKPDQPKNSSSSLQRLMEGNERYVNGQPTHPNQETDRRSSTAAGQEPFAIIVGCSDSRVPPELVFDQGIGDLFVVRVAGNVVGALEMDSIEFAATQLHSPLILVLGHERCGAVNAVMTNQVLTDDLVDIAPLIRPAVERAKGMPGDPLTNAIKANVQLVVENLKGTPILGKLVQDNKLQISGAYYNLDDGKVSMVP